MIDELPDVPIDDWTEYQSRRFASTTDRAIDNIPRFLNPSTGSYEELRPTPAAPAAAQQPDAFAADTSSQIDGLTPDSPVATDFGVVPTSPERRPIARSLPEPSAPPATDYGQVPTAPERQPVSRFTAPSDPNLVAEAMNAAERNGVDPMLYVHLIQQESAFKPGAGSPAGAQGLAQLMPATARDLGVSDPFDPMQSLEGGAKYLKQQLDRFNGDPIKALAAYNAGPGAVEKYGGVPPYEETQRYVDRIVSGVAADQAGSGSAPTTTPAPATGSFTGGGGTRVNTLPGTAGTQLGGWQQMAMDQLNKPYIWGSGSGAGGRGTGDIDPQTGLPRGFDCSGYVAWVLKNGMGIDLPAQTASAYQKTQAISQDQAQPGDIVFYNMNQDDPHVQHMAIYLGGGKIIEAGGTSRAVNIDSVTAVGTPEFRRPAGSGAQAAQATFAAVGATAEPDNAQLPSPSSADAGEPSWWDRTRSAVEQGFSNVTDVVGGAVQKVAQTAEDIMGPRAAPTYQAAQVGEQQPITPEERYRAQAAVGLGSDVLTNPAIQTAPTTPPVTPSNLPPATETLGAPIRGAASAAERVAQTAQDLIGPRSGLAEAIGTGLISGSEEARAEQETDVQQGQALANTVVDQAKQAGWQPTPQQERAARDTLAMATPMNVLMAVTGSGELVSARALVEGLVGLGLSAGGSAVASEMATNANLPEPVRIGAGVVGGVVGPIVGHTAIGAGRAGVRATGRALETPEVQAALRSRMRAQVYIGGRAPEPPEEFAQATERAAPDPQAPFGGYPQGISRVGTDTRPGVAGPGELTRLGREELPNRDVFQAAGAKEGSSGGFMPPAVRDAELVPGTENLPQNQRVRQVIEDMEVNPRIPRDLHDPRAEAFAERIEANGQRLVEGTWTPEATAVATSVTLGSIGRGQQAFERVFDPEASMYERVLTERPTFQTQTGPAKASTRGLVIRPELAAAHSIGDVTSPIMARYRAALALPALDELPAGTPISEASFATRRERDAAIAEGAQEMYRRMLALGHGKVSDVELITGTPITRRLKDPVTGERIPTEMGMTGRKPWADAVPQVHRVFEDWANRRGVFAGMDTETARDALLVELHKTGLAGIRRDKFPFLANMSVYPQYGVLDLRIRRDGFGLDPKASLTAAERARAEDKLSAAFPSRYRYVSQWKPWAYLSDEKTDYTSLPGVYDRVNDFAAQARADARARGISIGQASEDLARRTPSPELSYPTDPVEVVSRIGVSPRRIKDLPPGTTGEELERVVPEVAKFAQAAGVEIVDKPSVGTGSLRADAAGNVRKEGDLDQRVRGLLPAVRFYAASFLAAEPAEESVMLAHTGPNMAHDGAIATIRVSGTPEEMGQLHVLATEMSPEGWHVKSTATGEGTADLVIAGPGQNATEFSGRVGEWVNYLEKRGFQVHSEATTVEPATVEFITQADVEGIIYGGPRGAQARPAGAQGRGLAGVRGGAETGRGPPETVGGAADQTGLRGAAGAAAEPAAGRAAVGDGAGEPPAARGLPAATGEPLDLSVREISHEEARGLVGGAYDPSGRVVRQPGEVGRVETDPQVVRRFEQVAEDNQAAFNGRPFWSGVVDLRDGHIERTFPYEAAEAVDFNHSFLVPDEFQDSMRQGERAYFWINNGKIEGVIGFGGNTANMPEEIAQRIKQQITWRPGITGPDVPRAESLDLGVREVSQSEAGRLVGGAFQPGGRVVRGPREPAEPPEDASKIVSRVNGGITPRATPVEKILDSGLIVPGARPAESLSQILGPRGEVLSTVASRDKPPGVGVAVSPAGVGAVAPPSKEVQRRMPNLAKLAPDMPEVQATIQRVAEENPELINAFRQGRISHQQLINDLAPALGMTAEDFLRTKVGRGFNPEELLTLRAAVYEQQKRSVQLATDITNKGGVDALSAQEKAQAITQLVDAARLQAVGRGAAATAGRTLNQQKIVIDREMAAAITGSNEARSAQRALEDATRRQTQAQTRIAALERAQSERALSAQDRTELRELVNSERGIAAEVRAAQARQQRAAAVAGRATERQQQQAAKVLERLGGQKVTDDVLKRFVELQQSGDPLAAAQFLRSLANTSWWDRISILRYASMLSATSTHLTNAMGNAIMLGLDVGLKPLSVGFDIAASAVTGGPRTRYMAEIPQQIRGMLEGVQAGEKDAAVEMRTGIRPSEAAKLDQVRSGFNSGNQTVDMAVEAPLRLLGAADSIFRGSARGGQVRALATRQAIQEGLLAGAARDARINEIVANITDFPELVASAEKGAARVVLQEFRGEVAPLASRRGSGPAQFVQALFLPFVKTPYNIAAQGIGMTPAGFAGAIKAARNGNRGEAADRAARALFGTAVMGVAGGLGINGFLTGPMPDDEATRSTLPPGWQPWALRIPREGGAMYIRYQNLGPVGVPIAIAAVMTEAARQGRPFDIGRAVAGFGRYMVDQTFLQGLDNVIKAIEEPDRYAENLTEGLASSYMPYGALQRQIERAMGMAPRDPHGAVEALQATFLPTAEQVQPRTTSLGEPMPQGQSGAAAFVSPLRYEFEQDEPTLRLLRENGVGVPPVPKSLDVPKGRIDLTQQERDALKRARGEAIAAAIGPEVESPRFGLLVPEARVKRLTELRDRATQRANVQFLRQLSDEEFARRREEGRLKAQRTPFQVGPFELGSRT